jgi:hypothetical protein
MLEGWDPLVALLVRAIGYLLLLAAVSGVLYTVVKYAVCAGIKLAADDLRSLARDADRE